MGLCAGVVGRWLVLCLVPRFVGARLGWLGGAGAGLGTGKNSGPGSVEGFAPRSFAHDAQLQDVARGKSCAPVMEETAKFLVGWLFGAKWSAHGICTRHGWGGGWVSAGVAVGAAVLRSSVVRKVGLRAAERSPRADDGGPG